MRRRAEHYTCQLCGKGFERVPSPRRVHKFCTRACSGRTQRSGFAAGTLRSCAVCRSDFTPRSRGQRACGSVCGQIFSQRRRESGGNARNSWGVITIITADTVSAKTCPSCGRPFTATHRRRVFCSRRCRMEGQATRRRYGINFQALWRGCPPSAVKDLAAAWSTLQRTRALVNTMTRRQRQAG